MYGTGFKDLSLTSFTEEQEFLPLSLIRLWFRQVANMFGYWLQLNRFPNVLGSHISEERNMFVAENFIHSVGDKYNKHTVYTDGGTWYPQACTFLHLKHRLHSPLEKCMI